MDDLELDNCRPKSLGIGRWTIFLTLVTAAALAVAARLQPARLVARQFDKSLWKDVLKRHECIDDLKESGQLLQRSVDEVEAVLGAPRRTVPGSETYGSQPNDDSVQWR